VGDEEVDNLEMAELIAEFAGKPLKYRLEEFHKTRPGHDRRYALDGSKLAEIGWKHPVQFRESLERTVKWTMRHPEWLQKQVPKNDLFWHPV
jgi:dTDP-glucose 4,6-dehydratase